jgi:hypothetical protein
MELNDSFYVSWDPTLEVCPKRLRTMQASGTTAIPPASSPKLAQTATAEMPQAGTRVSYGHQLLRPLPQLLLKGTFVEHRFHSYLVLSA